MFAVMILGIGFIMIAGMFPVAIQQSQATVADTTGTIVAEGGVRTLKVCPVAWFPAGPDWAPMGVGTQAISAADPRFGFIGFARQLGAQHQVITFAVEAKNTSAWPDSPLLGAAGPNGELNGANHAAKFKLQVHIGEPTLIYFDAATLAYLPHAVEGAMVLISDLSYPALRGTVFTLGAKQDIPAINTWQVLPLTSIPLGWVEGAAFNGVALNGFIIGAGLNDPTNKASGRNGPSIAVHTSSSAPF